MSMTFDDGITEIYRMENTAEPGNAPKKEPVFYGSFYFGYPTYGVSINRETAAHALGHTVSKVINIDLDREINEEFVAEIDEQKYQVIHAQSLKDDEGLWFTQITLERMRSDVYQKA